MISSLIAALLVTLGVIGLALWLWTHTEKKEELAPGPESPLLKADDTHFYIHRSGNGPTLVLLHGIGASSFTWRLIESDLSKSFHLINIDLPGFGRSEKNPKFDYGLDAQARRVLDLLDQLKLDKAYLMGSSMGGALALWLARLQPRRFPKVLTLAPATSPKRVWLKWQWVQWLFPVAPMFYNRRLLSRLYRRVVTSPDLITEETIEGYHLPFADPHAVVTFLKATELLSDPRLPAELAHVQSKVCLVYGSEDKVVPQEDIEQLHKILPNCILHVHSGGHHLQEDDPKWVAKLARDFFLS